MKTKKSYSLIITALLLCVLQVFSQLSVGTGGSSNPLFFKPFITTWITFYPGTSGSNQVTFPGVGNNYSITWFEVGNPSNKGNQVGNNATTITFPHSGVYSISVKPGKNGTFTRFNDQNKSSDDAKKLLTIEQWGDIHWLNFEWAFSGCSNMTYHATDAPDLSEVTNLGYMFNEALNFNGDLNNWNTSNIEYMYYLFTNCIKFNGNIVSWNTSKVKDMSYMFLKARKFNQPIGNWNTGNVQGMRQMFREADNFNQPIGNWNTSKVLNMEEMFANLFNFSSFNQPIGNWNVSNVIDMSSMFYKCPAFNQPLNNWNVSKVTDMSHMFDGCNKFNQPLNNWNVSKVTDMEAMFAQCYNFNQPLNNWNVSKVTDMSHMFGGGNEFSQPLNNWNVSNVTNMASMFAGVYFFNQPLNNWDVSNVTDMTDMFIGCNFFNQSLSNWNIQKVEKMDAMLNNTGLSIAKYDSTLKGWANQDVKSNVTLGANNLLYCNEGELARQKLITTKGWSFVGDAKASNCGSGKNDLSSSSDDKKDFLQVNVYPNPSSNGLFYISNLPAFSDITVSNLLGEVVHHEATTTNTNTSIDLSRMGNGVYFINLNNETTYKIVKN